MKKIFILLASIFFLTGCAESVAVLGTGISTSVGAANGKMIPSSLQSAASLGVKKKTGKTPLGHALNYIDNKKNLTECSSFNEKKEIEICLTEKEKITSGKIKIKEKRSFENQPMNISLSLQSSIDKKSKIKYLD